MASTTFSEIEHVTIEKGHGITVKAVDKRSMLDLLSYIDGSHFGGRDRERKEFLHAARALVRRLETPREALFEMGTSYPLMYSSLRVCQRLGIFEKLSHGGSHFKSTADLCKGSPADPNMIRRYLRHLASMHVLTQADEDHWGPTGLTEALRRAEYTSFMDMSEMLWFKLALSIPDWLARNDYRESQSAQDCAWMDISSKPFFDGVKEDPEKMTSFVSFHQAHRRDIPLWLDTYASSKIVASARGEGPIIVEQGSSSAQDMIHFLARYPESACRLAFQGTTRTLEQVQPELPAGVTAMSHDILEPQPVRGARVYFMHDVLHYWPDETCLRILDNLKPAFTRGYSSLLLVEMVLTTPSTDRYKSSRDLVKCNAFGSKDRTAADWRRLLARAGFAVVEIHGASLDESVIEAVLI